MLSAFLCVALMGQVDSAPPTPGLLTIDTNQAVAASAVAGQRWSTWVDNLPRTDARGRTVVNRAGGNGCSVGSGNGCSVGGSNGCSVGSNGCSTGGCNTGGRRFRLFRRR